MKNADSYRSQTKPHTNKRLTEWNAILKILRRFTMFSKYRNFKMQDVAIFMIIKQLFLVLFKTFMPISNKLLTFNPY